MRVILVPVSNRPESESALKVAFDLSARLSADVIGCHLRPHREASQDYKPKGLPLFGSPNQEWLDQFGKKGTVAAAKQSEQMFSRLARDAGLVLAKRPRLSQGGTAQWQEKVGSPDRIMAIMGPVADLVIVTRPAPNGHVARLFLTSALLHSGRPVLLLPARQSRGPGRRIAIAWNRGVEVARLVTACMPLIQQAEAVTIITAGVADRLGPKSSQLQGYLKHWGVKSTVVATRGNHPETEILDAYKKSGSDLLLMGAYSRSRFRELVFGGMTQHMLWKARIPVIMQHG